MDYDRVSEIKKRFDALSEGKQKKFIRYLDHLCSADNPASGGRK